MQTLACKLYVLLKERGLPVKLRTESIIGFLLKGTRGTLEDGSRIRCHGDSYIYAMAERHLPFRNVGS